MNTYSVLTPEGRTFTVRAYSNFNAGAKAQSIGGSQVQIRRIEENSYLSLQDLRNMPEDFLMTPVTGGDDD
jgi:hypothetical protein